jgi:hypothetical protein
MAPCSATRPRRRGSLANCQAKPATAKAALRCPPNHRHGRTSAATAALVLSDTSPRVPLDCLLFLSVPRFAPPRLLSPGPPRAVSEHAPALAYRTTQSISFSYSASNLLRAGLPHESIIRLPTCTHREFKPANTSYPIT